MSIFQITIDDYTAARLDGLAASLDCSRSWLATEAIEQFLAHRDWMDQQTIAAIADIDAGAQLISHEDVVAKIERRASDRDA